MKKPVVGFLYDGNIDKETKIFIKLAKKKNINLILFNIFKKIDWESFNKKIKQCSLIYNNTGEPFVIEVLKTIEELGKTVIDKSSLYYDTEDKWMFYIKCKKHNIPTLSTILLSENINIAQKELKEWRKWPIVLKRINGTMGEYVDKADNIKQAVKIINRFWKKSSEKLPIIAQEFVSSPSYRATIIDKKVVQTAIKKGRSWKATGVYEKDFEKFTIDSELEKILKKITQVMKINICGVDLLKKDGKWLVLEVNCEPGFDFFKEDQERLVGLTLNYLKKECKK